MTGTYFLDLRDAPKPSHTTPASHNPRPLYTESPTLRGKRARVRKEGGIKRIVLHQWGVAVSLPKASLAQVDQAKDHDRELARQLAYRAAGLNSKGKPRRLGGTPYHVSVGVTATGNGVVALVWPRETHTFHAEAANAESIGVGIMARFTRDDDAPRPPGLAVALRWGIVIAGELVRGTWHESTERVVQEGFSTLDAWWPYEQPVPLRTHSQTQRKPADPGMWAIRHGVSPLLGIGAVSVEPDFWTDTGQPWPASWRRGLKGL